MVVVVQSLSHIQLFCNLMDYSQPDAFVHGIFHVKYWSWVPFPPPGDLPNLGTNQCLPH